MIVDTGWIGIGDYLPGIEVYKDGRVLLARCSDGSVRLDIKRSNLDCLLRNEDGREIHVTHWRWIMQPEATR